ncbi:MAG TPA: ribose-5-phosphate isomerase RpiA [Candidatus Acidoferrum sp.]|nr:ribose-5-phosphate isomerase RpiA [Candidatus Acidoferrum sp.]
MDPQQQNQEKKAAAIAAAKMVETGMVIGLGTGTTAKFLVDEIGRRVAQENLRIIAMATSEKTAEQARRLQIPLATFAERTDIDLTIDGADEVVSGPLYLVKGHGGALLREKIVAAASRRMFVIVDESKIVAKLGTTMSIPVEVVPFGWETTRKRLEALGAKTSLRMGEGSSPFITDGGHMILDCDFGPLDNPKETAHHLDHVVGAVEHGLFLGFAEKVFVGGPQGVRVLEKNAAK